LWIQKLYSDFQLFQKVACTRVHIEYDKRDKIRYCIIEHTLCIHWKTLQKKEPGVYTDEMIKGLCVVSSLLPFLYQFC
jgi:hypothetical protein